MFRLANYSDDQADELYRYLSSTASKVIYNALDIWAGSIPAILSIYMMDFAGSIVDVIDTDFFDGISKYISVNYIRPEINRIADEMRVGRYGITDDGKVGMELLARKIDRMKEKMADPEKYYTFDLFEEYLFAKMLENYVPESFEGVEDPYKITSDEDVLVAAERLLNEFKVGEDLEAEIGEEGIGKDYADWLAHTIHRVDQMDLWSSEEAGFESLFFWDTDYEMVFSGTFVEGIRGLVSGTASIMGYGYEDVRDIFEDAGIKAPLLLVGSEAAFDIVGEVSRERVAEAMKNTPAPEPTGDFKKWLEDDDLPFS